MERIVHTATRLTPLLLSALFAATAGASIPEPVSVQSDSAGAPALTIVRLEPDAFMKKDALTDAMNACVDDILARSLDTATPSCDRAVTIAAGERAAAASSVLAMSGRRHSTRMLAAAVSNRAVLKWLKADATWERDLKRAQALAPSLDFVQTNAAVIGVAPKPAVSVVAR
jgi:hypothetical protein